MVNTNKKDLMFQIGKFVIVGGINTGIDFVVLNILMFMTGYSEGPYFAVLKGLSFIVAVTNSYIMNKFWTFKEKGKTDVSRQFTQFFIVSLIGMGINVTVASLVVNFIPRPSFIADIVVGSKTIQGVVLWANVGTLTATFAALVWNFIGYKMFVFKKQASVENI